MLSRRELLSTPMLKLLEQFDGPGKCLWRGFRPASVVQSPGMVVMTLLFAMESMQTELSLAGLTTGTVEVALVNGEQLVLAQFTLPWKSVRDIVRWADANTSKPSHELFLCRRFYDQIVKHKARINNLHIRIRLLQD